VLPLAIERAIGRAGADVDLRLFYPTTGIICQTDVKASRFARGEAWKLVSEFRPDVVLVDHFWLPIQNEMVVEGWPKDVPVWLLVRVAPYNWLDGSSVRKFNRKAFSRIISIEPPNQFGLNESIEPVVVCNRDELLPKSSHGLTAPFSIVVHRGMPGEQAWLRRNCCTYSTKLILGEMPAAPHFLSGDELVGGMGYGFTWETRWLGVSSKTKQFRFERGNEPFEVREQTRCHKMRANGADMLVERLLAG
jgi:hypothetical protein